MTPDASDHPGPPARARVAGTTPYPWPWDGVLDGSVLAVLVVAGPGPAVSDPQAAGRCHRVVEAVRSAGGLVVEVRTRSVRGPVPAAEPEPDGPPADAVVVAAGLDGFHGSALDGVLRAAGRRTLLLAGSALETSVHSTLRSANDRGYECLLVADACQVLEPSITRQALSMVEMSGGIFGAVGHTDAVVAALDLGPGTGPGTGPGA